MKKETRKTLGKNAVPKNYKLLLEPNLKTFKYKGSETVETIVKESCKAIRLNAAELEVADATIESGGVTQKARIKFNKEDEELALTFGKSVKGNVKIHITFTGTNNYGMYGFYRSKYSLKGKEAYMLTSQFEAADARKAFPCFDEPSFKATFELSFLVDKELNCISNMPVKSEKSSGNSKKLVTFHRTPKMSSYLLYLGVGKFERKSSRYKKIDFGVVTVPGKSKDAVMALEFGKKFLAFYESYFGVDFPLPKMDLIAVPDFAAGAMENWGAITFREIELLGDEKSTSVSRKQRIAEVIAHELAHQWFGDLVTMEWWDDLWLNESFATFMATKAVDSVFPKWEFGLQDSIDTISTALSADQYISTHPINVTVNEPKEIVEIFDRISYEKGGSLLAMLEDYAGKEIFRKGLHSYLKKHSYSNATKYDLWNAIEEVVSKGGDKKQTKFAEVAKGWIDKTGYPIVEVQEEAGGFRLLQSRYLLLNDKKIDEIWQIPVHYTTKGSGDNFMLFGTRDAKLGVDSAYLKLNHAQKGIYRVRYPDRLLNELGHSIKSGLMENVDAWGVENDLYAMARSSRIDVSRYMDFAERYCFGGDYPLSFSVSGHLNGLEILFSDNEKMSKRVRDLSIRYHKNLLDRVGLKESADERNITTLSRSMAISSLGLNGHEDVLNMARKMFNDYLATGKQVPKNIRSAVYNTVAWHGDEKTYAILVGLYKKEDAQEEKRRLLVALSNSSKPELVKRALEFSLSKEVRPQDAFVVSGVASSNEVGKKLVWDWTRKNWKKFMKMYDGGTHMLSGFVGNLGLIDDESKKKEIEAFFAQKGNMRKDMERTLKQTLELIEANIRFKEFNAR